MDLSFLPEHWAAVIGQVLVALVALRTLLRALVAVCWELDTALDGRRDWAWVGKLGDVLDRVDDALDRLPVKAPLMKGR